MTRPDVVIKTPRDRKEADLRDAAMKMKEIKAGVDTLAKSLSGSAVQVASA